MKKERERGGRGGGRGGGEGEVKRGGVVERPPWSGSGRVVAGCREVVAEATPVEVVAEVVAKVTPVVTLVEVVLVTEVVAKVTPVESWLPAVAEEEAPLAAADLLDLPLPAPRRPRLDDGTLGTGSSVEVVAKVTPVVTLVEVVLVTEVVAKVTPVESWLPAVAEEEAPLAAADLLDLPLPAPRRPRLDDGTLGTGSSGAVPPPRLRKRSLRRQPEDGSTCDMI